MSDPTDKKSRWVVKDKSSQAVHLSEKPNLNASSNTVEECGDMKCGNNGIGEGLQEPVMGDEVAGTTAGESAEPNNLHKGVAAKNGRKGRNRGEILLTSYEQEMVEWALKGFLPSGPSGFLPTPADKMQQVEVVPMEEEDVTDNGDDQPKKKSKVMLLQVRKKGNY